MAILASQTAPTISYIDWTSSLKVFKYPFWKSQKLEFYSDLNDQTNEKIFCNSNKSVKAHKGNNSAGAEDINQGEAAVGIETAWGKAKWTREKSRLGIPFGTVLGMT